ncbi:hypothetical protein V7S43_000345 [Phytophthora oleae]|uniref:Uncharacterized protein n=1 Tax=Phytophthora oleae TaxID=2107226 RepID=A0ABD3G8N4_9STRA
MSGHQNHSNTLVSSSSSTSQASNVNVSLRGVLNPETKRLPLLKGAETPAKFDKQVEVLPIRFQAMTRITPADTTTESRSRPGLQRSIDDADDDRMDEENPRHRESGGGLHRSARKSSANGDQKRLETDSERATYIEQPIGLVVALFHDGFVCRHINKENEGVEGFAQPYDAESSYFLACIDNGRVPEGLPDMIACAHNNGSVLAEIRDYRDMRAALCPVSSAFLPAASALLQADAELDEGCHVWQTLLLPGKSPLPFQAQVSSLFEPPTLQSIFDHFPDVTPSELETLAMDAKQQLLQEKDVLLSSSSTDSSSPRDDTRGFGGLPTEPQEIPDRSVSGTTTTPTTRSHLHSDLGSSPPASLLSPITRKSARSSLSGQEDTIAKPCKRQIQTSAKGGLQHRRTDHANSILSVRSQSPGMEICTSPRCFRSDPSQQSYSEVLVDDAAPVTPLPATQLFLSKLKGKRRRPDNELLYGKPAWVTIAHVGRFYRAATRLEREHSRFLHVRA